MSQAVDILEYVSGSPGKVDREAGVIHDVKVLGQKSANGRRYLPEAIEKAIGLYEGRSVNVNHPIRPGDARSAYDRFGWLEGLHVKDGELYARKFHYLKSHSMAGPLAEAAERHPEMFGLSHNARGRERKVGGEAVIESIDSVLSVDLVADPATVKGLHESRETTVAATPTVTLKSLLEILKGNALQATALQEMATAAGMGADAAVPTAADTASPAKPDEAIKAGFKAAIHAVVDDDSMDMAAKLSKIKDILKAQEKLMGGGSSSPADTPATPVTASRTTPPPNPGESELREELNQLKRKDRARELCEEANVKPSATLLKALVALHDEADVKALVEEHRAAATPPKPTPPNGKPRSAERAPVGAAATPITEDKAPADTKSLGKWLRE